MAGSETERCWNCGKYVSHHLQSYKCRSCNVSQLWLPNYMPPAAYTSPDFVHPTIGPYIDHATVYRPHP